METLNHEVCPACGQTINERILKLNDVMLRSLIKIVRHAEATGRHEFERKELDTFLKNGTEYATFGDWIHFGGIFYKPKGRGYWGIHLDRAKAFLSGNSSIPIEVKKRIRIAKVEVLRTGTIYAVPKISTFLNENREYIAHYC